MIDKFIQLFSETTEVDVSELNSNSIFRDLEDWDSLSMLALIAMIKTHFNVLIPRSDFDALTTIETLYNYVKSKE